MTTSDIVRPESDWSRLVSKRANEETRNAQSVCSANVEDELLGVSTATVLRDQARTGYPPISIPQEPPLYGCTLVQNKSAGGRAM